MIRFFSVIYDVDLSVSIWKVSRSKIQIRKSSPFYEFSEANKEDGRSGEAPSASFAIGFSFHYFKI